MTAAVGREAGRAARPGRVHGLVQVVPAPRLLARLQEVLNRPLDEEVDERLALIRVVQPRVFCDAAALRRRRPREEVEEVLGFIPERLPLVIRDVRIGPRPRVQFQRARVHEPARARQRPPLGPHRTEAVAVALEDRPRRRAPHRLRDALPVRVLFSDAEEVDARRAPPPQIRRQRVHRRLDGHLVGPGDGGVNLRGIGGPEPGCALQICRVLREGGPLAVLEREEEVGPEVQQRPQPRSRLPQPRLRPREAPHRIGGHEEDPIPARLRERLVPVEDNVPVGFDERLRRALRVGPAVHEDRDSVRAIRRTHEAHELLEGRLGDPTLGARHGGLGRASLEGNTRRLHRDADRHALLHQRLVLARKVHRAPERERLRLRKGEQRGLVLRLWTRSLRPRRERRKELRDRHARPALTLRRRVPRPFRVLIPGVTDHIRRVGGLMVGRAAVAARTGRIGATDRVGQGAGAAELGCVGRTRVLGDMTGGPAGERRTRNLVPLGAHGRLLGAAVSLAPPGADARVRGRVEGARHGGHLHRDGPAIHERAIVVVDGAVPRGGVERPLLKGRRRRAGLGACEIEVPVLPETAARGAAVHACGTGTRVVEGASRPGPHATRVPDRDDDIEARAGLHLPSAPLEGRRAVLAERANPNGLGAPVLEGERVTRRRSLDFQNGSWRLRYLQGIVVAGSEKKKECDHHGMLHI